MIALDANTALRGYREAVYDLGALADGLLAIVSDSPYVYWFKYADGRTQPVPTRALVHRLTGAFPRIVIGSSIALAWHGDALHLEYTSAEADNSRRLLYLLGPTLGDAWREAIEKALQLLDAQVGLAARVSSPEYAGDGIPDVKRSYFKKLTVTGTLSVDDASRLLEGQEVGSLEGNISSKGEATLDTATAQMVASLQQGVQRFQDLKVSGMAYPGGAYSLSQYVARPNVVPVDTFGSMESPAYFGQTGLEQRLADTIEVSGASVALRYPTARRSATYLWATRYRLPYYEDGVLAYLPAGDVTHQLYDEEKEYAAPAGMGDMLLWPCWALVRGVSNTGVTYTGEAYAGTTYSGTTYTDYYMYAIESNYIVIVKNASEEPIHGIPNAWQFARSGGRVSATVLNRVTLPPMSSVEFLFSHDGATNAAYMYPLRALED